MDFHSFYPSSTTCSTICGTQNLKFYTAPSSPIRLDTGPEYNNNEFEFDITTRRFTNPSQFQKSYASFWWTKRNDYNETYQLPARAESFCSGQVLPLKPPPWHQTSVSSLPRSPNSPQRLRFSRRCAWNDDFDPFQFALEKVSNETRARMSFRRRSQSYSSYRTSSVAHWLDGPTDQDKGHKKQEFNLNNNIKSKIKDHGHEQVSSTMKLNEHLKPRGPTLAKMLEHKESVYSRRVVPGDLVAKPKAKVSQMALTTTEGSWFGRRLKDVDHEHMKGQNDSNCSMESKIHRVVSFLFKLKKGSNESRPMKLGRCLGYAPGNKTFTK